MSVGKWLAGLFTMLLAAGLVAMPAGAATDGARDQYVAKLDPICKSDAQRNSKVLRGTRRMVLKNQFRPAARRFARVANNFQRTLARARKIAPPASDRATVNRWLKQLQGNVRLIRQMSRAVGKGQKGKAQRLEAQLARNTQRANSIIFLFGFKHCQINLAHYR